MIFHLKNVADAIAICEQLAADGCSFNYDAIELTVEIKYGVPLKKTMKLLKEISFEYKEKV